MRRYYTFVIALVFLIALPFSLKIQADDKVWVYDTTFQSRLTIDSISPPFVVYYFDTVGWREVSRDSTQNFEAWETQPYWVPQYDNPAERKIQWLVTIKSRPIVDTIIVGYFYTDIEPQRIRHWRVRRK